MYWRTVSGDASAVGIDMGVKTMATLSDGTTFGNPKYLRNNHRRLRVEQRKLSKRLKKRSKEAKQKLSEAKDGSCQSSPANQKPTCGLPASNKYPNHPVF